MKRLPLCLLSLSVLVGCNATNEPKSEIESEAQTSVTSSDSGSVKILTYSNPKMGIQFQYPKGWRVVNATKEDGTRKVVAWVYSPAATLALIACQKANPRTEWQFACSQENANTAMAIFDYGFIDYDGLGEFGKTNYPAYQALNIKNLDAFQYDSSQRASMKNIHINNPKKTGGVTLITLVPGPETTAALGTILSSFTFTSQ